MFNLDLSEPKLVELKPLKQVAWNKGKTGCQVAWNKGIPRSAETRAKIGAANKGKIRSKETLAKMSAARKGKPGIPRSAETRAKISAAMKGKPNKLKGIPRSAETRAKLSAGSPRKRACKTPLGLFDSIGAAARAHNLDPATVRSYLIGSVRSDWNFVEKTAKKVVDSST